MKILTQIWVLPQTISDGRLDSLLGIFAFLKGGPAREKNITLDWTRVQEISPAGFAILACLFDTLVEQGARVHHLRIKKRFKSHPVIQNLTRVDRYRQMPEPEIHSFEDKTSLFQGYGPQIHPVYSEQMEYKFKKNFSEDFLFACRVILNELMVNCVDHATADRYYVYSGTFNGDFLLGVLDMGVTIPAKLERKYGNRDSDVELLELSFKEGITTRRQRIGGFGLHHTFEIMKQWSGRLTVMSRNAQIRRYFHRRSILKGRLKFTLDGTWCLTRFPKKVL